MTYLAFILFVLFTASVTDEEWIEGGYEFDFGYGGVQKSLPTDCSGCEVSSAATEKAGVRSLSWRGVWSALFILLGGREPASLNLSPSWGLVRPPAF